MPKNMKYVMFFFIFGYFSYLPASQTVNIQLRIYEGFKEQKQQPTSVRSYFLKEGNMQILSEAQILEEKQSLIDIYNLQEIKNLTNLTIEFQKYSQQNQVRDLLLKKNNFKISLTKYLKKTNTFSLKIFRRPENSVPLMDTEIILPPTKAVVIGFRDDRNGNSYFFSFQREKNSERREKKSKCSLPYIKQKSVPGYPEQALEKRIEGNVILEGCISIHGLVENIKIWDGNSLLTKPAVSAFKNWKFTPYVPSSTAKTIKMVLIFVFKINGKNINNHNFTKILTKIKKTAVWKKIEKTKGRSKQKPWLLQLVLVKGKLEKSEIKN